MTHYARSFFWLLIISLTTTMVAIGYFSVINTTREAIKMTQEVENKEKAPPTTTQPPTVKPETHLRDYDEHLYQKTSKIFELQNKTIGPWLLFKEVPDLVICPQSTTADTKLVLITTMPYSSLKEFIFNNTITNWGKLKPYILPVLFIAKRDIIEKSGVLIHRACSLGWAVAVAPTTIKSGFPMLRHMFSYAMKQWDAPWFGFSNGDILLTEKLVSTLSTLTDDHCLHRVEFLTAQRHNAIVSTFITGEILRFTSYIYVDM